MFLKKLKLKSFRNYREESFEFSPYTNIIYGENGQGKTNILEAIYVGATSKSHRTGFYKDMIELGEKDSFIDIYLNREEMDRHIKINLASDRKRIYIDSVPVRKMEDFIGFLHVIMFSPEDLDIIKKGPVGRRRFIDIELSQLSPLYYHYLYNYHNILKQRNVLLKKIWKKESSIDVLEAWDVQLIKNGKQIIKFRREFIDRLASIYKDKYEYISGKKEKVSISYDVRVEEVDYEKSLISNRKRDIKNGSTSYGPHRDDLIFYLEGHDIRIYGSQGQQRTASLALKLAEIDVIEKIKKQTPILLLDDVFSELDISRQTKLVDIISDIQSFITTTDIDKIKNIMGNNDKINYIKIKKGKKV